MELFKIFYEIGILACLLAIFAGSQVLAIYLELWADRPKRKHIRK